MSKSEELLRKYKSYKENKSGENSVKAPVLPVARWYPPTDPALCLQQLATLKDMRGIDVNLVNESGVNSVIVASGLHARTLKHISIDFSGLGVVASPMESYKSEVFMSSRKILGNLGALQLESLQLKNCPNLPEFCRDLGKLDISKLKYFNISFSNIGSDFSFEAGIYDFVSQSPSIRYFNFTNVYFNPQLVQEILRVKPYIHLPPSIPDPGNVIADMRSYQLMEIIDSNMKAPLELIAMVLDYLNPNIQVELIGGIDASFEGMDYGLAVDQVLAI